MKMKKIVASIFIFISLNLQAQENNQIREVGFNWNKVFIGGSGILGLGFGQGSNTTIGINPEIGYSLNKNIDLGIAGNFIYSVVDWSANGIRDKQTTTQFGMGVFTRIHINDGFFLHGQPEFNNLKYKVEQGSAPSREGTLSSTSLLAGIGWGQRNVGNVNFYSMILVDVQNNLYSPYRINGSIIPVVRVGGNFYFNRKKRN